jgi:dihydrofolate synthase/folylpolyglutamate synthase
LAWDRDGLTVELPRLGATRVGLRGRHQAANAAVADALLDALATTGIATIDDEARRRGYGTAVWPGRLELLDVDGDEILLDGAHNPAGAAALAQALDDLRPWLAPGPMTLVMAAMADKDVDGIIAALLGASSLLGATVIATTLDAARAMPADELAARWRAVGSRLAAVTAIADPLDAVEHARRRPGPTVVAGSLYLVGAVRAALVDDPDLRYPPAP